MLTAVQLRSQVDQLWDKLWSGGLSNPLDAIEQLSYLLFLKRIDDEENARERQARLRGLPYQSRVPDSMRWGTWTHLQADAALTHLKATVFPQFKDLGTEGSSFAEYMKNAECKINKPSLLIEACKLIDAMQIGRMRQDSERKWAVTRVSLPCCPPDVAYAACSTAHTSSQRSWNRWR